uniref:uncharacterized protein LOC124057609 isoform X2 n=1 Tax=Scatophagus argus TaxID=75038 RepID=UPI001ED805F1|nr:uncharacterized protein LOC124057609 isoform X2 [Scatophagus argus]
MSEWVQKKIVGCVMNERRKHQVDCSLDGSVHGEQRRNFQSKSLHESTLLPPRPRSYGDAGLLFKGSELLGLQVQGFCCPLQQRPSSGSTVHKVTPKGRGGGNGSVTLLSSLKGRLESSVKPASRFRTGSRPEMTPGGGAPIMCHYRDPVSETAETLTRRCDNEMQAGQGHLGAAKVSELHLYLPLCDDEEQDAETEEMRYEFVVVGFGVWMPLQVRGERSSASFSTTAPRIIPFPIFHVTFAVFTLLSKNWNRAPKLVSEVMSVGGWGDKNILSHVKTCPLCLNGICYIHGIIPCNNKAKEVEFTGCSVKRSPVKHQCTDGKRHRYVKEEGEANKPKRVNHLLFYSIFVM